GLTLVVGAPQESVPGTGGADTVVNGAGAAYVFQRPAGAWQQVGHLTAPSPVSEEFGWTVALAGKTVAVGELAYAVHDGATYLFAPTADGTWSMRTRFTASMARPGFQHSGVDEFGRGIGLSSTTLVVAAPYEYDPQSGISGTVYAFE
ncbi:MAG TPA: hypothetical protein VNW92_19130, partial [Polyangiaceae bacterium]|nr:hypothetical protein [Polyangiaceae bacterium]